MLQTFLRISLTRMTFAMLAGAGLLFIAGCETGGRGGGVVTGAATSLNVPLVPQSERPERVSFLMRVELEDAEGRRVARIPIRYEFPEAEITLLTGQSASPSIALRALQAARITSELSPADAAIVSADRQTRSSLMPLYGDDADLSLNAVRFQVARQAFGVSDDLQLNVQSFYADGRLVIGVWAEMYTPEGDWAGFHPAFDSWITVPLAQVGQARLDELVVNVPALNQEIRDVLRQRATQRPGGSVDLQQIVPPGERDSE